MRKSFLKKLREMLFVAFCLSVFTSQVFAEDVFAKKLSDADFETGLFSKLGVAVPVYLGCNRGPKLEPDLPLRCRVEGTEIRVSELEYSGIRLSPAMAQVKETPGWVSLALAVDAFNSSKAIEWALEPTKIWVSQMYGRTVFCLIGNPIDPNVLKGFEVFQAADCISLSHSAAEPSQERTLRVKFFDTGKMSPLLSLDQTEPAEFESTVTFFMYRAFAVPGLGLQQ